jgi:hypothetical protein
MQLFDKINTQQTPSRWLTKILLCLAIVCGVSTCYSQTNNTGEISCKISNQSFVLPAFITKHPVTNIYTIAGSGLTEANTISLQLYSLVAGQHNSRNQQLKSNITVASKSYQVYTLTIIIDRKGNTVSGRYKGLAQLNGNSAKLGFEGAFTILNLTI